MIKNIEFILVYESHIEMSSVRSSELVLPNFRARELMCPLSRRIKLDARFANRLQLLRERTSHPLAPTSVCRSTQKNIDVSGHKRSLHLMDNPHWPTLGTIACDVSIINWKRLKQEIFIEKAKKLGFSIGHGQDFIHLDARDLIGLPRTNFHY